MRGVLRRRAQTIRRRRKAKRCGFGSWEGNALQGDRRFLSCTRAQGSRPLRRYWLLWIFAVSLHSYTVFASRSRFITLHPSLATDQTVHSSAGGISDAIFRFQIHPKLHSCLRSTYQPVEVLKPRDFEGIVTCLWGNIERVMLLDASCRSQLYNDRDFSPSPANSHRPRQPLALKQVII